MRDELLDRVALVLQLREESLTKSECIWLAEGVLTELNLNQEVRHFGETTEYRYCTPWKTV